MFCGAHHLLETEASEHSDTAHAAHGSDLAVGERIHDGVDGREMSSVEDVGGLDAKFQGTGLADGDVLAKVHVEGNLAGTLNDIAASIAEGGAVGIDAGADGGRRVGGRAKGSGVEPLGSSG